MMIIIIVIMLMMIDHNNRWSRSIVYHEQNTWIEIDKTIEQCFWWVNILLLLLFLESLSIARHFFFSHKYVHSLIFVVELCIRSFFFLGIKGSDSTSILITSVHILTNVIAISISKRSTEMENRGKLNQWVISTRASN